ncbi:hypothetical protein DYB28_015671, partial [Aphanomyces astaci]
MAPHGHSHAGYGATNEATPLVSSPKKKSSIALSESSLRARKKLQWACLFSLVFMVAEVVGGFMAGSLAIMTDAAHLLSDVAGFCISLFAIWVQTLPASSKMTFGFHRAEILGAIVSVLVIWVLTGFLVYAAIERFQDAISDSPKEHVDGKLMFIVALRCRYNPKWQVADPVATFLFSILVLYTTVGIIRSSVHVLMEGTPEGFDVDEILHGLETLPSVSQAHDLHIWSLNAGLPSLSVHLV